MSDFSRVDVHVGSRVRLRRVMLGMSQERLADRLGITFQQVQKYEKGSNRMSASRLYDVAATLSVPVTFFFEGAPALSQAASRELSETGAEASIVEFISTREGIELNRAFCRIADSRKRRQVLKLVDALAPPGDDQ
jgi:transcriptional regulator with XRE-family HTH domain